MPGFNPEECEMLKTNSSNSSSPSLLSASLNAHSSRIALKTMPIGPRG